MKAIILLALVALINAAEMRYPYIRPIDDQQPSLLGYLKNVSVPTATARRLTEEKSWALGQTKIVGGSEADQKDYPWQAGLIIEIDDFDGIGVCGASLVTANRLLTAAHCWYDGVNQAWRYTVVLGTKYLFMGDDGVRQQTSHVVYHPTWSPSLIWDDIAVIYLPQDVTISDTIAPVSLPLDSEAHINFSGFIAHATGFGLTSDGGSITDSQALSEVSLAVIGNSDCWWSYPLFVWSSNICTSGNNGKGPCNGDSGGPLVTVHDGRTIQIGIVSFGSSSGCESDHPTVYSRITYYLDFINEHL